VSDWKLRRARVGAWERRRRCSEAKIEAYDKKRRRRTEEKKQGGTQSNQQQFTRKHTNSIMEILKESARRQGCWDEDLTCEFFWFFLWTVGKEKHSIKLTDQPGKLIPLDRGGVPDLSVSGDKSDFCGSRPSRSDYDERDSKRQCNR
jgi:hypothetical protein